MSISIDLSVASSGMPSYLASPRSLEPEVSPQPWGSGSCVVSPLTCPGLLGNGPGSLSPRARRTAPLARAQSFGVGAFSALSIVEQWPQPISTGSLIGPTGASQPVMPKAHGGHPQGSGCASPTNNPRNQSARTTRAVPIAGPRAFHSAGKYKSNSCGGIGEYGSRSPNSNYAEIEAPTSVLNNASRYSAERPPSRQKPPSEALHLSSSSLPAASTRAAAAIAAAPMVASGGAADGGGREGAWVGGSRLFAARPQSRGKDTGQVYIYIYTLAIYVYNYIYI
ncbi:hypothetical protein T492DRAFT_209416 [Pavlovales sp. CCMP2436]|nr:hypothetical protein T492DRAFT_209416 [Pavlovales sp. CCMP2436]